MERYYYDQRRFSSHRRGGGGGRAGFIFPFLLLIVICILVVFGFRLVYFYFFAGRVDAVFLYVAEGQAKIKLWGTEDYVTAYDGTRIFQGDEVFVAKDSKIVVEFFDGTIVRLAGDTQVVFNDIYKTGSGLDVQLVLKNGDVWVNKTAISAMNTDFYVLTDSVLTKIVGTVSSVGNHEKFEVVRALSGSVEVDVYSKNGGTFVDHITVSDGNQALFDSDKLERFWKFQAPNVVENISMSFIDSSWYKWNFIEDADPTDFASVGLVLPSEEVEAELEVLPAPEVGPVVEAEPEVEPAPEVEPEVLPAPEPEVLELGPLGTPSIVEINGVAFDGGDVTVSTEPVKVVGKVSGAMTLFVNDFKLQRFEPKVGEETFVYWMKEEYKNLVPGENTYEVYALAEDGTRSASVFFKVIFEPLEPPEPPEPSEPSEPEDGLAESSESSSD